MLHLFKYEVEESYAQSSSFSKSEETFKGQIDRYEYTSSRICTKLGISSHVLLIKMELSWLLGVQSSLSKCALYMHSSCELRLAHCIPCVTIILPFRHLLIACHCLGVFNLVNITPTTNSQLTPFTSCLRLQTGCWSD